MSLHYNRDHPTVSIMATLLGCSAGSGLVNDLNDLARAGIIEDGDTFGWIELKLCEKHIARLGSDITRKPLISNLRIDRYTATGTDRLIGAEVTFTATRKDGRTADMFASVLLHKNRNKWGVHADSMRVASWLNRAAIETLGPEFYPALAKEIDAWVDQDACRAEVA
jgi:hypothetical protein